MKNSSAPTSVLQAKVEGGFIQRLCIQVYVLILSCVAHGLYLWI
jgi:hypothetical protein